TREHMGQLMIMKFDYRKEFANVKGLTELIYCHWHSLAQGIFSFLAAEEYSFYP
ncbi:hypothetical protein ACJX0J_041247, partial [Zea mays]